MKQLRYNFASNVLRIEYPPEWDGKLISGVTVGVDDKNGDELLAAQSVTLYTATTLDGAVARYANQIVLDSGADALSIGDPILICGAAGDEVARVKDYVTATKTVTLESVLENEYPDNGPVYGLFGTYTLDTTATATYTAGKSVVMRWAPTGDGAVTTEIYQISISEFEAVGIERRFGRLYERAYDAFRRPVNIFNDMYDEAFAQVKYELEAASLVIDRLVNIEPLIPLIMAKMAYLWALNGDEKLTDERAVIEKEYGNQLAVVKALPLWIDTDQDEIEDSGEVTDHQPIFNRGW